jgi:NADPH:quinone reductase-like Zn-dependent oxidoreductase
VKAAVIERAGDTGKLRDVATPVPGRGEILVHISAAGVNPIDWKLRDDPERPLPFVLGQDFSGVVSELGEGVTKYREGERVFGIARAHGAYAEYTLVPEDDAAQPIAKIPDGVGDADAAALPTAGLTALAALDALNVGSGTQLLIVGVAGGVGSFASQLAKERGAHVIGTARSKNYQLARSLGVDDFVAYDHDDPYEAIAEAHPNGVDAVLDLVGDRNAIRKNETVMRKGGAIVSTIGAADEAWFAQHGIAATNLVMQRTPQSSHHSLRLLAELVDRKRLRVVIAAEHSLTEAESALAQSKSGSVDGKIVLTVDATVIR